MKITMKITKKRLAIAACAASAVVLGFGTSAAATQQYRSTGQVTLPGGVTFDAQDLEIIEERISSGKSAVGSASKTLNGDADEPIGPSSTFAEIADAIANQISLPADANGDPKDIDALLSEGRGYPALESGASIVSDNRMQVSKTQDGVTYGTTSGKISSVSASGDVKAGKFAYSSTGQLIIGTLVDSGGASGAVAQAVAATKVGTAGAPQVLSGYTFTNSSTVGASGTMPNYSSNIQTITADGTNGTKQYDVLPDGYHTSVKVNQTATYNAGVTATKKGNAVQGNVLSGKTFTSTSGVNLTGSMPNRGNVTDAVLQGASFPAGYYSGWNFTRTNYANATSVGWYSDNGTEYAHVHFPSGYYYPAGTTWGPEIRMTKDQLRSAAQAAGILDESYQNGLNAGALNTSLSSVDIHYHQHTSACNCPGTIIIESYEWTGSDWSWSGRCNVCGVTCYDRSSCFGTRDDYVGGVVCSHEGCFAAGNWSEMNNRKLRCGKNGTSLEYIMVNGVRYDP